MLLTSPGNPLGTSLYTTIDNINVGEVEVGDIEEGDPSSRLSLTVTTVLGWVLWPWIVIFSRFLRRQKGPSSR